MNLRHRFIIPLSCLFVSVAACDLGDKDVGQETGESSGNAEGGSAEGGSAEGGSAEGGSDEGGSAEGGSEGGSAEGGGGYDPCEGLACGDACQLCPPDDPTCVETAVVKVCDAAGQCVADQGQSCDTPTFCGGIAGIPCPDGETCIDDPSDDCDPENGGADCGGICVPTPEKCTPEACGPAPGAPNIDCWDGSIGGPACGRGEDGTCGWTFVDCPYNPCEQLACGDTCQVCPPDDPECVETAVIKVCDAAGHCVADTGDICESEPCYVGGCSDQVCSAERDVVTTCEWIPEYACYADATCERQVDGACGWTETPELLACLEHPQGHCGGFAGLPCPDDLICIDDPSDDCDPENGGADCGGICVAAP